MEHNTTDVFISKFQSTKLCNKVKHFFKSFKLAALANKSNIKKDAGISTMNILYRVFLTPFFHESLSGLWKEGFIPSPLKQTGKDTYYRFLSNHRFHWRKLLNLLAIKVIKTFNRFSIWQERVLILDDSTLPKRGRHIELVSWVFDSVLKKSTLGFKNLLLGWSDGFTFIPFDFSLIASSNQPNNLVKDMDKRTIGAKRRKDALRSKMDMALEMINKAYSSGIDASFCLFDSWFAFPSFINKVYHIGYNVICKLKNLPNIRYTYKGKPYCLDALYRKFAKNSLKPLLNIPGKYASLNVTTKEGLRVKIVFYFEEKGSNFSAFLSTDLSVSPEKVLMTYAKRWPIEPFFKECKQNLYLGKEQCRNFDSVFASNAIAFIRYIFLSVTKRLENDPRTLGELFQSIQVEMKELSVPEIVLELIADEVKKMSRTLNLPETVFSQVMQLLYSIRYYLSSLIIFDEPQGCES